LIDSDKISFDILTRIGMEISPLQARNDRKEADFIGTIGNERYIIEAKVKTDDPQLKKDKEEALSAGEVHITGGSLGPNDLIAKIIRSGAHQLRASAEIHKHDYKILIVASEGINRRTKSDNVLNTLYGRTLVLNIDTKILKPCYFFYNAEFFRRGNDIDAVIECCIDFSGTYSLQLCLNPYSDCYQNLRDSSLSKVFESIIDPFLDESKQLCYMPDANISPSKPADKSLSLYMNPMLLHLKEKYKTGFLIALDYYSPELTARVFGEPES